MAGDKEHPLSGGDTFLEVQTQELPAENGRLTRLHLQRWAWTSFDALSQHEQLLNELNIYPAADHDTGTTLATFWCTFADTLGRSPISVPLRTAFLRAVDSAMFVRGSSASIFSEWLAAFGAISNGDDTIGLALLAEILRVGAAGARRAVVDEVEGTMLTVFDAVAADFTEADARGMPMSRALKMIDSCITSALRSHPVPRARGFRGEAGSEDAGAYGARLVLAALTSTALDEDTRAPDRAIATPVGAARRENSDPVSIDPISTESPDPAEQPSYVVANYEVTFRVNLEAESAQALRDALTAIGVAVVLNPPRTRQGPWNAHVHVADPEVVDAVVAPHGRMSDMVVSLITSRAGDLTHVTDRHIIVVGNASPRERPNLGVGVSSVTDRRGLEAALETQRAREILVVPNNTSVPVNTSDRGDLAVDVAYVDSAIEQARQALRGPGADRIAVWTANDDISDEQWSSLLTVPLGRLMLSR